MPEGFMGASPIEVVQHQKARELAKKKGLRFEEALRRVRQASNR